MLLYEDALRIKEVKLENVYILEEPVTDIEVSTQNVVNLKPYIQSAWDE